MPGIRLSVMRGMDGCWLKRVFSFNPMVQHSSLISPTARLSNSAIGFSEETFPKTLPVFFLPFSVRVTLPKAGSE